VRRLIGDMSRANPLWDAPRIHGEILKLGLSVSQATASKYMVRNRKPPSQTWRTFLDNHVKDLVAIDFFTVPTATFRVLFVLVVLHHYRRQVVHFNVTEHPTAGWTAQQLVEAFPWDAPQQYLLRDRDGVYGATFQRRAASLGIEQALTAPRSPWQNPFAERLIGSVRRDCLDHVIVLGQRHLRRILTDYSSYYIHCRTHLALAKDTPKPRPVEPPLSGDVVALPRLGGLHHRYTRLAA
jgi:transposase InsO family protein